MKVNRGGIEKDQIERAEQIAAPAKRSEGSRLSPDDYHVERIAKIVAEIRQNQREGKPLDPRRLADIDLLLTDAFLIYGSHLLAGRTDPATLYTQWTAVRRERDLAAALEKGVETDTIRESLQGLLPSQPEYRRLREALVDYREVASKGGWPRVSPGPRLQKGDEGDRVRELRARLRASGDLSSSARETPGLFHEDLERAVRRFQSRHGLDVDGVVGPATLEMLNVSANDRARQIEVNLERWRWLPQDLGDRYVLVNIANFELDVVENGSLALTMRAIAGRPYRRTPVFSDRITYLVLNPYWHVPPSIAVQDALPLIKKDTGYLERQKMRVFQGWGADAREIDPKAIDWSRVTRQNFSFRLRQDPGPLNALGHAKFMFPNRFNVYLHDTPARELFGRSERSFSSGCIRVEKPLELAEYLLKDDPRWTRQRIEAALERAADQTVRLPRAVPVHLLYWTAWAELDGTVHFRKDIYDRDEPLSAALRRPPPGSTEREQAAAAILETDPSLSGLVSQE